MRTPPPGKFAAVILAGDRGPADPLAAAAGVGGKALVPVGGRPMLLRVLEALGACEAVDSLLVCGSTARLLSQEPELAAMVAAGSVGWIESEPSPSLSAMAALAALPDERPVLLTTADHALLTPRMVAFFCEKAAASGCDVAAGLVSAALVKKAFPESRRTVTRLRHGGYCGCNLFAFLTPRGRRAATFWRGIEASRKKPLKIVQSLGLCAVLRYLLGRLTLEQALDRLSAAMGARAGAVWMSEAEAAVDVDSIADWRLVEKILAARRQTP
jgi:GTP:adenosylcobinamide-phosphate guanylyltransferase